MQAWALGSCERHAPQRVHAARSTRRIGCASAAQARQRRFRGCGAHRARSGAAGAYEPTAERAPGRLPCQITRPWPPAPSTLCCRAPRAAAAWVFIRPPASVASSYSITRARDRALRSHRNRSQIFVKNTFPVTEHSYVAMRFDQHVYLWIVQTLRATQTDRTRTAPQYKRLRQSQASQKGLSPMHDACCTRSLCIASQHHPARHGKHHVRLG